MAMLKIGKPEIYLKCKNGDFQRLSTIVSDALWDSLKKYLDSNNLEQKASNIFHSRAVFRVCRILDIYSIPQSLKDEYTKDIKQTNN